jgi:hypothetical protein
MAAGRKTRAGKFKLPQLATININVRHAKNRTGTK